MEKKTCIKCKIEKDLDLFPKDKRNTDGRFNTCRACKKLYTVEWFCRNPKKKEEYKKKNGIYAIRFYQKNKDRIRKRRKFIQYGLTPEQFSSKLLEQENKCKICGILLDNLQPWTTPHVDHDHSCCDREGSCGKCVRGLLCGSCNHMLGQAKDNPTVLQSGIDYLRFYQGDK